MGEHRSVRWRKLFTKHLHLNCLRMNRRIDSKWLKIPNQPLHLYPLLHLYIYLWVCAKLLQSCPTLCNPVDCSPPGSFVHRILQARILDWVAIPSFRGSSQPRDRVQVSYVSCIAGRFFIRWAIREAQDQHSTGYTETGPSSLYSLNKQQ